MITILPGDFLVFALILFGVGASLKIRRNAALCQRWAQVWRRPLAGVVAGMLLPYLLVVVLDCIHLEQNHRTASVLDIALTPLRDGVETSYSAPFASHALVAETRRTPSGFVRERAPLKHGAQYRELHGASAQGEALAATLRGLLAGGLLFAVLILPVPKLRRALGKALRHRSSAWRVHFLMLLLLCVAAGVLWHWLPRYHVLGTDKIGQDVLYQSLKSVRTAFVLGLAATLLTLPLAVGLGLLAGYLGGRVDDGVQFLYAVISSVPGVLLIAAGALAVDLWLAEGVSAAGTLAASPDFRLLCLCTVLGLTGWTSLCRLVRGEVMKLRSTGFIWASEALGSTAVRVMRRHLLPNVLPLVLITTVLDFSSMVLAEAVLTYINIGIDPAIPSWGNLINAARLELAREPVVWWSLAAAFIGMVGLVLPINLLGDLLRDEFDPRSRAMERTP